MLRGQDSTMTYERCIYPRTIVTDTDGAMVFVDGVQQGTTPIRVELAEGQYTLSLIHPEYESWLRENIQDTIGVFAAMPETLYYTFASRAFITSEPFNAEVFLDDSLLGTTPLVFDAPGSIRDAILHVRKPGYESMVIDFRSAGTGALSVKLERDPLVAPMENLLINYSNDAGASPLRLYIAGAGAVISGALAAHFKLKADDNYAVYRFTRDPALLDRTNRFDTAAALCIAATQVSLGLFTYFILAD